MILFRISREAFLPFLIASFIAGLFFGAVYDVFRIRRRAFASNESRKARIIDAAVIFIEDVLFSVFVAVAMILICFKFYFGIPRWYSFASAVLGFYVWRITLGRLVIKTADAIIALIKKILAFIATRILYPPVLALKKILLRIFGKLRTHHIRRMTRLYEKKILDSLN